jgi:hypothetical protein
MAKRAAKAITKSLKKVSKKSSKATNRQAKEKAVAEDAAIKNVAPSSDARLGLLTGREAKKEERFRELAAWYILQGLDEATARQRAQDQMDDDPRKD